MFRFSKSVFALVLASFAGSSHGRPNVIIMQPDDFPFMNEWTAPPDNPNDPTSHPPINNGGNGLQHINRLRLDGVQMMQAYTASPVCGTSRYSTITGKMPSRAASVRDSAEDNTDDPATVTIPTTKLIDVNGQNDCSEENLAWAFQNGGYKTGMFGKWHLSVFDDNTYTYENAVGVVQGCGFTTVGGLYIENLNGFFTGEGNNPDKPFSHNMEFMTYEAIKFINATVDDGENFFMYFNPTVPHSSGDVLLAIQDDDCEVDIPDPNYPWSDGPLWIKGMVEESDGCRTYRNSIQARAVNDDDQGKIWVDDSVGALLEALDVAGELSNTIFLFQEDHGMDTKAALYEGGIRIPQFVHYPDGITPGEFHGLVSTVDIAATMLDFAGIPQPYELDGKSWKDAIGDPTAEAEWKDERCLFFEVEKDRAVRCGCYKWLDIFDDSSRTYNQRGTDGWGLSNRLNGNLFDLCGGTGDYITNDNNNQEAAHTRNQSERSDLVSALECHAENTDPDDSPVYSVCPNNGQPAPAPTGPTPTDAPQATCQDSPLEAVVGSNNRDCAWISSRGNRCSRRRFYSHCQQSCSQCGQCEDSRQTFVYNGQETSCGNPDCQIPEIAQTCPDTCGACW